MLPIRAPISHKNCIICSSLSPLGLDLKFMQSPDDQDEILSDVFVKKQWGGYDSILHGGIIASLLDAAMTHCLFNKGIEAVTAEMVTRYLKPIPLDAKLRLIAKFESSLGPLFILSSKLLLNGDLMSRATAKFMRKNV